VKNGATAIETLGDSIDASLWNSGFGQAGKNKIINGNFGIWQRGTTATITAGDTYLPDRFASIYTGGGSTQTWSRQTFTPGTAPVAGYEGSYFSRMSATSGSGTTIMGVVQRVEDVRTLAGQTATLSFWAKADSARTVTIYGAQNFGSGGSGNQLIYSTTRAITTSWARYTVTANIISMTGKTIGTNNNVMLYIYLDGGQASGSPVLDIWGVQWEAGSVATPFQTASGGSPQAELAMCQRYYTRWNATSVNTYVAAGNAYSTTTGAPLISFPVEMRVAPTSLDTSGVFLTDDATNYSGGTTTLAAASTKNANIRYVHGSSTLTALRFYYLSLTATTGYLGLSAEL
jgi:hypothetical protein